MQLCKWADKGLITRDEYRDRLRQLGYTDRDSNRIATVCEIDSQARRIKASRAEARQALSDTRSNLLAKIKDASDKLKALNEQIAEKESELASMG
jgi:hypothetical protein